MRGKIKRVEPAGDASAVDEVRKAGKEVSICEQWGLRAPLGKKFTSMV